jgi:hypothetical protein
MNRKRQLGCGTTVPRGGGCKFQMDGTCGWKELGGDRNLVQNVLSSGCVCHTCAANPSRETKIVRKIGRIIRRLPSTWLVRI